MGRTVRLTAASALAFVALPGLVVLVSSFSSGKVIAFPPSRFSLASYGNLLSDPTVRAALLRSLTVGIEAVAFSVLIAVPASLALFRHRIRYAPVITVYLLLGVSTPLIVSAFAFLVLYTQAGVLGALWPISLAIAIVNLPFVLLSLASVITRMDPRLEQAAATLGAEPVQTFLFVTLPGLMPGILSGALLIFALGITDFVISLFLTSVNSQTLPVVIYGSLRGPVPPLLAAAAGVYFLVSVVVVLTITNLRATGAFLYRGD